MAGFLTRLFSRRPAPVADPPMGRPTPKLQRRFEAAQTNRLNQAHWADAKDESVNSLLCSWLPTLRARSGYEYRENPHVRGVVGTHVTDVIGLKGPTLQIADAGKRNARRIEQAWNAWWRRPDAAGQLSGPAALAVMLKCCWLGGEYVVQIANGEDLPDSEPVRTRIRMIHPRRLDTPVGLSGMPDVIMGVKRTPTGRPLAYYILDENVNNNLTSLNPSGYQEIPAGQVIHGFFVDEPDQARGVPWLASCLQTVADLRDYQEQVMDCARAAADSGVLLGTENPEAQFNVVNESVDIERRTISTLPPGYKAYQITPQQPSTQYEVFVADRLRALGRPAGMPLMMIQLDSRQHNYSSARFDSQIYRRGLRAIQGHLEETFLSRLLDLIVRELDMAEGRIPSDYTATWSWEPFPYVDPEKEAAASEKRLSIGASTLRDECNAENRDWEQVVEQRKTELETFKAAGLPLPEWLGGKPKSDQQSAVSGQPKAEEKTGEDAVAAGNRAHRTRSASDGPHSGNGRKAVSDQPSAVSRRMEWLNADS